MYDIPSSLLWNLWWAASRFFMTEIHHHHHQNLYYRLSNRNLDLPRISALYSIVDSIRDSYSLILTWTVQIYIFILPDLVQPSKHTFCFANCGSLILSQLPLLDRLICNSRGNRSCQLLQYKILPFLCCDCHAVSQKSLSCTFLRSCASPLSLPDLQQSIAPLSSRLHSCIWCINQGDVISIVKVT